MDIAQRQSALATPVSGTGARQLESMLGRTGWTNGARTTVALGTVPHHAAAVDVFAGNENRFKNQIH